MKKVIYVTGCFGFIGSWVASKCLEEGWYVYGVDKLTYASRPGRIRHPNFKFQEIDINDMDFLYDCDYIVNCAAETHVGNSIINSDEFVHSNISGVHNLLELVRNYRQENGMSPTLLHFSTDEVYGDIVHGAHTECDILKPSNPYSATKAAADMLILAWARTYGIPYNIIRPTNNYGTGQYVEKLIPKSVKYLHLGRKIPLHNGGEPYRNWLHVEDTANAVITIIKSGNRNEIYNVAGGLEMKNIDVVSSIIREVLGDVNVNDYIDFSTERPGVDVRYALDDSKIRSLGWKPMKKFDEEIKNIVSHYLNTKFIW
jgi:dTDP-glucose 4,6-dehydratase